MVVKTKRKRGNRQYIAGRRLEYKIKHYFEDRGFIVIRSAGSKSMFDLVAYDGAAVWLIQCKKGASRKSTELLLVNIRGQLEQKLKQIAQHTVIMVVCAFHKGQPIGSVQVIQPANKLINKEEDEYEHQTN